MIRSPAVEEYLDRLDEYGVPIGRRVVAALGPRMLRLAAQRSAGAHPCMATPEHSARARAQIGTTAFLAPEHKVVLNANVDSARALGRKEIDSYLDLANYVNNWKRLGYTDDDFTQTGSDRLVDALVAHGTAAAVAAQLHDYLNAGADHVAIRVLGRSENLVPGLAELAGPLGLIPK